jgi:2-polyprenyl-3-methyl-5-hydroxy-6-metoxy-1,4-benzoquinol methylase
MTYEDVVLESAPCPLGCHDGDEILFVGRDYQYKMPGEFPVVECKKCGIVRTSPRPTPETIGLYYPSDYGPYLGTQVSNGQHLKTNGYKSRLISFMRGLLDAAGRSLPGMPAGRMLEIGCASGSFLHEMAEKGWTVEGIEYSPTASAAARSLGYDVDNCAVEDAVKPNDHYDLVVGWMVLEHLHDPVACLRKFAQWAKPTGKLAISVPDCSPWEFKAFGANWYALHLPNHLYHFSNRNIVTLLDAAGWRVTRIKHHRTIANLIGSVGFLLEEKGVSKLGNFLAKYPERSGRMSAIALLPLSVVYALFKQTGRMTVWAERKNK